MRQHSERVRFVRLEIGRSNRLFSVEIANRDGGDLHGRFWKPGNTQDRTCRRHLWEVFGECSVQGFVSAHVVQVHLNINEVIHGQTRRFDNTSYILKTLADLVGKVRWSAAVLAAWPLR